jgi:hypothetical protein
MCMLGLLGTPEYDFRLERYFEGKAGRFVAATTARASRSSEEMICRNRKAGKQNVADEFRAQRLDEVDLSLAII